MDRYPLDGEEAAGEEEGGRVGCDGGADVQEVQVEEAQVWTGCGVRWCGVRLLASANREYSGES